VPILGICLGHQCVGQAFGGRIARAKRPLHGEASEIVHDGEGLFANIPGRFNAGRYHSLIVELDEPSPLRVTARSEDGEIMALEHREYPVFGVQFHPESVLTEHGHGILRNFLNLV
jgi:para-aminobenzoate synthetase component 2